MRRGQALTEWKRKCADNPANPEEGPLSGDDEVDAPLPTLRVADDLSSVPMPVADPIAEEDLMDEKLKDLWDERMSAIPREDKMMLCLVLFQLCRKEFKLGAIDADKTTAKVTGQGERTIRRWRKDFVDNGGEFSADGRGKNFLTRPLVWVVYHLLFRETRASEHHS